MAIYFKENIRHIRAAYGLSQKAMAEFMGGNYKSYQSYELGRCQAPYEFLEAVSIVIGVSIDELIITNMAESVSHIDILRKKRSKNS